MTDYIFRLATAADGPAVRRLQTQFVTEMNDPLGIDENTRSHTEFFLLEVADQDGCRVVGMMSLLRASKARFVFEQVFPEVWRHVALPAWLGRLGIRRSDLVEGDWGYIEQPYRGSGFGVAALRRDDAPRPSSRLRRLRDDSQRGFPGQVPAQHVPHHRAHNPPGWRTLRARTICPLGDRSLHVPNRPYRTCS